MSYGPDARELHVTMPNGEVWAVPFHVIIDSRSRYYAERDKDTTYEEEYRHASQDKSEVLDWAANNMNWDEVVAHARKVDTPAAEVDWEEGWTNGEKRVFMPNAEADR